MDGGWFADRAWISRLTVSSIVILVNDLFVFRLYEPGTGYATNYYKLSDKQYGDIQIDTTIVYHWEELYVMSSAIKMLRDLKHKTLSPAQCGCPDCRNILWNLNESVKRASKGTREWQD